MKRTVLTFILALTFTACASTPPRQVAVVSLAAVDASLSKAQDAIRQACNEAMYLAFTPEQRLTSPITECAGPVATAAQLSTEKFRQISAQLADAFAAEKKAVLLLKAVSPGTPVPPEVGELRAKALNVLQLAQSLAVTDRQKQIVALAATVVAEVEKIIVALRGGN